MKALIVLIIIVYIVATTAQTTINHRKQATFDEIERMIAMEKEQARIRKEQEKQAKELEKHEAWLRKHDEQISALETKVNQAEKKIDFLASQMESLKDYGEYLELERDSCVYGSSNWHKWNNKWMSNNAKVYRLSEQMDKAYEARRVALEKLEVA